MKGLLYHLPYVLAVFIILFLGATDLAAGVETKVLMTWLAPIFWLGVYWLGSRPAPREES